MNAPVHLPRAVHVALITEPNAGNGKVTATALSQPGAGQHPRLRPGGQIELLPQDHDTLDAPYCATAPEVAGEIGPIRQVPHQNTQLRRGGQSGGLAVQRSLGGLIPGAQSFVR